MRKDAILAEKWNALTEEQQRLHKDKMDKEQTLKYEQPMEDFEHGITAGIQWQQPLSALEPVTPPEPVTAVDEVEGEEAMQQACDRLFDENMSEILDNGIPYFDSGFFYGANWRTDTLRAQLKAKEAEIEGLRDINEQLKK